MHYSDKIAPCVRLVLACLCLAMPCAQAEESVVPATQYRFAFADAIPLPELVVDGVTAHVHTQGLFVTDKHYWVTGRLETSPKRALWIRFSRDLGSVEYLDITPTRQRGEVLLDHPGGFDRDAKGRFQIPVSSSNRRGPTIIQTYWVAPDQKLSQAKLESSQHIGDHLGAICCHDDVLVGANWDTLKLYFIRDGKVQRQVLQQDTLSRGKPHVAVQDWKAWSPPNSNRRMTILGGLVKGQDPSAVVQVADLFSGEVVTTVELESRQDVARLVTNEGLAVHDGMLYLLPEDIGRGAKLLRYRISTP